MTKDKDVLALERYNRQNLIEGWKQEKLSKARIAIIGGDQLANFTAVSLSALGIGNIEIYDDKIIENKSEGFLYYKAQEGNPKAKALENILNEMNPLTKTKGVNLKLEGSPMVAILGKPDVLLDLTNSPGSKKTLIKYSQSKRIPIISASSDNYRTQMYFLNGESQLEATLDSFQSQVQGPVTSGIMSGLITEEVRKILMPLSETDRPVANLAYSLLAERRFSDSIDYKVSKADLKNKKVLMIGAGALGNFVGLGLTLAGVGNIDILDFDDIEGTNLNRQILFYDAVGKKKSEALVQRLKEISPNTKLNGIVGKIDADFKYFEQNKPDAILDCVDSLAVRAYINYFGVKEGIPVVSGGTDPKAGQVSVYVPKESSCLDCKLGVDRALGKALTSSSCRYSPDPSVIMTNEVIGGIMVGETLKVLDRGYGEPSSRIIKYDSTKPARGGLIGVPGSCDCQRPDIKQWLSEVITKYGVKPEEK